MPSCGTPARWERSPAAIASAASGDPLERQQAAPQRRASRATRSRDHRERADHQQRPDERPLAASTPVSGAAIAIDAPGRPCDHAARGSCIDPSTDGSSTIAAERRRRGCRRGSAGSAGQGIGSRRRSPTGAARTHVCRWRSRRITARRRPPVASVAVQVSHAAGSAWRGRRGRQELAVDARRPGAARVSPTQQRRRRRRSATASIARQRGEQAAPGRLMRPSVQPRRGRRRAARSRSRGPSAGAAAPRRRPCAAGSSRTSRRRCPRR